MPIKRLGVGRVAVITVSEFIDAIKNDSVSSPSFHVYRGVRNAEWANAPGILRLGRESLLDHERDAIRDLQAIHPKEFLDDRTMFDRLVRMQHFQLPTRLLDVTSNPLVSLYFATEEVNKKLEPPADGKVVRTSVPPQRAKYYDSDTVSCLSNLANLSSLEKKVIYDKRKMGMAEFNALPEVKRLLQFIRHEKPSFRPIVNPDELDRAWFVKPKLSNNRIIAQNGAFLIYGLDTKRRSVPGGSAPLKTKLFNIPAKHKSAIREELDILGVNQASLFPEIDRAAEYIITKYQPA